ncbi:MAG: prepilin-type N-terminal cleavage/methylation domain-containing protein [Desulfamplus sp.]|nr:prepilin-type N-terminal cleavage/methylation domain-containing protein [Desulfamplus sp.]
MKNNQKGFTLIELMIVVAIIGILAAIAIPNFLQYQLKSKTSEVKVNLGAIKTNQEAYMAETGVYLTCAANPAAAPTTAKQAWAANADFSVIGFVPSGTVFYQYAATAVAPGAGAAPTFSATGTGDLDGDATTAVYTITNAALLSGPVPATAF